MTEKERLEEIKNSHLRGIHSLFGTPWVSMPKENFDWLIEQAERVGKLENQLEHVQESADYCNSALVKREEQNKRYLGAIEKIKDYIGNYTENEALLDISLEIRKLEESK